ncbi:MAG: bifunctional hydroxymethylpyrimidine kinase/phosphomethylpyrimidine kinase [Myxococcaceae bacterium]|nr:bifunctional hydroxymethylpyrimidine kinase/phosphomethylpyrimidine kinase [Myxococcaceae bacterium]
MKKSIRILALGGWDATGRAGLLADAWAAHQLGAQLAGIATCLTVQGGKKFEVSAVKSTQCEAQLRAVLSVGPVDAIKIGAVPNRTLARWVLRVAKESQVPLVIDPVIYTSRGERLSTLNATDVLRFAASHCVLTPNHDELAWLGEGGSELVSRGFGAVVVKGGASAIDDIFTARGAERLQGTRVHGRTAAHRGTGCRFATALAVHLARGEPLRGAAWKAASLVRNYLQRPIISPR